MPKEFKSQVVLPTFYRAANDCMYNLMVCGSSILDDSHRASIAKLVQELDLVFKSITNLANDGKGSAN